MATLDDILTAIKNGVVAINAIDTEINGYVDGVLGDMTSPLITSQTLVVNGSGILVAVSVVTIGSTTLGTANDSLSTTGATAANAFVTIPNTIGVFQVGFRFSNGLVITPGVGQSIVVSYSTL